MNISELFIRRPVMTVLLTVSVVFFGILAYFSLPVNDLPAVDYPVIQVSVGYPGASPETVANTIATPLERQFMQIQGLEMVTSTSSQGSCSITLQFDLSKSVDAAATDVQTAITQATGHLPPDLPSPPTLRKTNPNDQPILYIALTSDSVTAGDLYDYASTQLGQQISLVQGISQVNVYGSKSAVRIKADPSAMAARGLSMQDLNSAVTQGTTYQGAGQFDGPHRSFLLQPQGQLSTARQYADLIVGLQNGAPIYLKDVARVENSTENENIDMRFWVRGRTVPSATVVAAVYRQAGANAVEAADAVKKILPEIQKQLPSSVRVTTIHDRSQTIRESVHDVKATLVIAFVLVVLVIFLFLGKVRDTLIPVVALPLSLLLTFVVMSLLGYSLDNLSLLALTLAVGFLVDDAIVFLENTVRRMEHGERAMEATFNSAREISFTILAMTISLSAVFLPLVFMPGLVGRIFREFAITIVVSIFASGIVSLTLTPLMCARLLKERGKHMKQNWIERVIGGTEHWVLKWYGKSLWFFLHHKWISALTWVVCLIGTFWLLYRLPKAFLPVGDSSFIRGVMIAQEGSSPAQMHALQSRAEAILHANPAVDMTFTATGISGFFASNQGFLLAFLKDPDHRAPIEQVAGQLMGGISGSIPGVMAFLQPNPVLQISTGATSQSQGQFAYSLSGINPPQVYGAAEKLMGKLRSYPGFATVSSDLFDHTPQLTIDIRRDQASVYGVSAEKIEALLRNAYSQNYVYLIKKSTDQYQVIMEVKDSDRAEPRDLSLLYVRSDDGKRLVPLNAVATWKETLGPQSVNHINQFTSVTIFFNLKPGANIGDATDFISSAAAEVVPSTIRSGFQGEALTFQNTVYQLLILMALAVFVMYVILGILYESYLHPLTVLSALPVALVGGLLTLWIFGQEASLYAFVGMFMLMGIVKKNGIMMVDFALQRIGDGLTAINAIHEASIDRFRPIIMTTLAAGAGILPIALGYGADGKSRLPLGLVIVGGLIVSGFITLYIVPAIYLYMELFQERVLDRTTFFHSTRLAHGGVPVRETEEERRQRMAGEGSNGDGDAMPTEEEVGV
jgi:HAE1 family hydrophobic/amphiphilic exporter-1